MHPPPLPPFFGAASRIYRTKRRGDETLETHWFVLQGRNQCMSDVFLLNICDCPFSAQSFDVAAYFDTVPELVSRTYNRPKKETLKNNLIQAPDAQAIKVKLIAASLAPTSFPRSLFLRTRLGWRNASSLKIPRSRK